MEPKGSSLYIQEPATGPHSVSDEYSPHNFTLFEQAVGMQTFLTVVGVNKMVPNTDIKLSCPEFF
jgi:hypothetical protein